MSINQTCFKINAARIRKRRRSTVFRGELSVQLWLTATAEALVIQCRHLRDTLALRADHLKRLQHIVNCLGSCIVCIAMSILPLMWAIGGLDGDVKALNRHGGSEIAFSEHPFSYLENMLLFIVFGIGFAIASLYWFVKAWWGSPPQ
jgi:hypothetical protein